MNMGPPNADCIISSIKLGCLTHLGCTSEMGPPTSKMSWMLGLAWLGLAWLGLPLASSAAFSAASSAAAASSATTTTKGARSAPAPPKAALVVVFAGEAAEMAADDPAR